MNPERETNEQNQEDFKGPDGTAPDSETDSSASSSRGTRQTEEHLNPNEPAEGQE
ncbi:hypothetical protein [Tellurirhabdus rosea]|uniref:hypothetical protein n=1 Tax=Tellurirhabdus rosea TaxID=2674997 RepID=UPI00224E3E5C|nr:hypothetical protein [Tellurirhabdus rosea]